MFGRSFRLFELFGFPVRIDLSWFVIAVLVTWSLAEGVFRQPPWFEELDSQPGVRWGMALAGAVGLFVSIVLHELGHAKVAESQGLPMRGITLFIFGGVAEMSDEPPSARGEFLVAVAGPMVTVVIMLACGIAAGFVHAAGAPVWAWGVLGYLASINLLLILFNMIPAFPLDGGRVLRSLLWHLNNDLEKSTRITSEIGSGFGVVLMLLAAVQLVTGNLVGAMWWFLIGIFLRSAAKMSYRRLQIREMLEGEPVHRFMHDRPATAHPDDSIIEVVEKLLYQDPYQLYPVTVAGELAGCLTFEQIKQVPRERWDTTSVSESMDDCGEDNTISIDADAMDALERMSKTSREGLLVLDGRRLAGILTLQDLLGFFSMKIELEQTRKRGSARCGNPRVHDDASPSASVKPSHPQ